MRPNIIIVESELQRALAVEKFQPRHKPIIGPGALGQQSVKPLAPKIVPSAVAPEILDMRPAPQQVEPQQVEPQQVEPEQAEPIKELPRQTQPKPSRISSKPDGKLYTLEKFCAAFGYSVEEVRAMCQGDITNELPAGATYMSVGNSWMIYIDRDPDLAQEVQNEWGAALRIASALRLPTDPRTVEFEVVPSITPKPQEPEKLPARKRFIAATAASSVTVRPIEDEDIPQTPKTLMPPPRTFHYKREKVHIPEKFEILPKSTRWNKLREQASLGKRAEELAESFQCSVQEVKWHCANIYKYEKVQPQLTTTSAPFTPVASEDTPSETILDITQSPYKAPEPLVESKPRPRALVSIASLRERFREKCKRSGKHWIWMGMNVHTKIPNFSVNGVPTPFREAAFMLYKNENPAEMAKIPQDYTVIATCGKYNCTGPECVAVVPGVIARRAGKLSKELVEEVYRLKELGKSAMEIADIVKHPGITPRNAFRIAKGWIGYGLAHDQ